MRPLRAPGGDARMIASIDGMGADAARDGDKHDTCGDQDRRRHGDNAQERVQKTSRVELTLGQHKRAAGG